LRTTEYADRVEQSRTGSLGRPGSGVCDHERAPEWEEDPPVRLDRVGLRDTLQQAIPKRGPLNPRLECVEECGERRLHPRCPRPFEGDLAYEPAHQRVGGTRDLEAERTVLRHPAEPLRHEPTVIWDPLQRRVRRRRRIETSVATRPEGRDARSREDDVVPELACGDGEVHDGVAFDHAVARRKGDRPAGRR